MLEYEDRPTSKQYTSVCNRLIQKYPRLTDNPTNISDMSAICTWKSKLRWKFKNGRRTSTAGPSSSQADNQSFLEIDDDEYTSILGNIMTEYNKRKRNKTLIISLMNQSFENRRSWILSHALGEVLDQLPFLQSKDFMIAEFDKLVEKKNLSTDTMTEDCWTGQYQFWRDKLFCYVNIPEYKSSKSIQLFQNKLESDLMSFENSDEIHDVYFLIFLQHFLSPRSKTNIIYTFSDSCDTTDIMKEIATMCPVIVRLFSDEFTFKYYIMVEGKHNILVNSKNIQFGN
jgi:hypothetical protein